MKRIIVPIITLILLCSCFTFTHKNAFASEISSDNINFVTYMGLYPQTIVTDNIVYDDLYVLSETKQPDFLDWYYYDDNYYAMIKTNEINDERTFSNGQKIYSNRKYFFKCEKIKWNVEEKDDSFILSSDLIIDISSYYSLTTYDYSTLFSESDVYKFLNSTMLSAIQFKENQTLLNLELNHDSNYNVNDDITLFKVNLPAVKCSFEKNEALRKQTTDYCLAKGIAFSVKDDLHYSPYWTSSVGCSNKKMIYVSDEGETIYNKSINDTLGILPMIAVKKG